MDWFRPLQDLMDQIEALAGLFLALLVIIGAGVVVYWLATRE